MDPTILVIDDSDDIHRLLDVRLKGQGARLIHAKDANEGAVLAATTSPDLILLDIDIAGTSGFEVCERLKTHPETWAIPIIFLTGTVDVATKVRAFDCGAVDYVTKPFEPAELRARVRTALRSKACQDLLASHVRIDELTGLWSRVHFESRVVEEMAAWKRYGRNFAVVLVDIDDFAKFNELHGHPLGDRALQLFAQRLRGCMRKTDTPSRYGGAQFAVMLRETRLVGGAGYAQRLRRSIESLRFGDDGPLLGLTASMGIAATDLWEQGASIDAPRLVASADLALYTAKHGGHNRVELAAAA
ncbi:MAG TPA: diguanylate cyclase [Nannocystaceae bacterium]|nr:diguanylate cyclase [Nannocystaceae bacterium]